jgi:pyrroloquinoline-quinone synthase
MDLDSRIASKHLLNHTFYQRWSAGTLTREELREYARQYWHFTLAFPTFVSNLHAQCDDLPTRQALLENLIEEERGPENHPELWLRFCETLGLDRGDVTASTPNASTRALVDEMRSLAREGALHEGLASLYAYESQIPAVATAKIEGLQKFYDISAPAFFSVHQEADVHHSATSRALLAQLCDSPAKEAEAEHATQRTLDALYGFLDSVTA